MSKQHPYPQTVVEAVAKELWNTAPASAVIDWEDIQPEDTRNRRSDYLEKAHAALSALWEASRVDTVEQAMQLADDAILWGADDREHDKFTISNANIRCELSAVLPAHVIHWGDHK